MHLYSPLRRDHHVPGLDVAVEDTVRVGILERVHQLNADIDNLVDRKPSPAEERRRALSLYILHHDVQALGVVEDVIHRGDVRMIELRGRAGFTQQADASVGGSDSGTGDGFQRDTTTEPGVVSEVHFTHSTGAELLENLVRTDGIATHGSYGRAEGITLDRSTAAVPRRGKCPELQAMMRWP